MIFSSPLIQEDLSSEPRVTFLVSSSVSQLFLILSQCYTRANTTRPRRGGAEIRKQPVFYEGCHLPQCPIS